MGRVREGEGGGRENERRERERRKKREAEGGRGREMPAMQWMRTQLPELRTCSGGGREGGWKVG